MHRISSNTNCCCCCFSMVKEISYRNFECLNSIVKTINCSEARALHETDNSFLLLFFCFFFVFFYSFAELLALLCRLLLRFCVVVDGERFDECMTDVFFVDVGGILVKFASFVHDWVGP